MTKLIEVVCKNIADLDNKLNLLNSSVDHSTILRAYEVKLLYYLHCGRNESEL